MTPPIKNESQIHISCILFGEGGCYRPFTATESTSLAKAMLKEPANNAYVQSMVNRPDIIASPVWDQSEGAWMLWLRIRPQIL